MEVSVYSLFTGLWASLGTPKTKTKLGTLAHEKS